MTVTINTLIESAYNNAKNHGFYEKPIDDELQQVLIVTEIAEAVEADRCDRHAKQDMLDSYLFDDGSAFQEIFEVAIKDSFEDEIADILIRIFSFLGSKKMTYNPCPETIAFKGHLFHLNAIQWIRDITFTTDCANHLCRVIDSILTYCNHCGIDILFFVCMKMRYNKSRPMMHGGKKY